MGTLFALLGGLRHFLGLALRALLTSRVLQVLAASAVALFVFNHMLGAAEKRGLEVGRTECRMNALAAENTELKRVAGTDSSALAAAQGRADEAEKVAKANKRIADRAVAAARAMPNAKAVCLSKEVTDEIRSLR